MSANVFFPSSFPLQPSAPLLIFYTFYSTDGGFDTH